MADKSKGQSKKMRIGIICPEVRGPPLAPVARISPSNSREDRTTPALPPVDKPHVSEPQSPADPDSGMTESPSSQPAPSQDGDSQSGDSSD